MNKILIALAAGLLSVSAIANELEDDVNSDNEIRAALFEGINAICDSYQKGPSRVYCQDAQFYGYQRFGKMAFSAKRNKDLAAVLGECSKRFRINREMIDYGMSMRCISLNIKDHNIRVK
mgnify:CR=1 FL=1|jgi:hypothetical protein